MDTPSQKRAIIIGAGPAGLTAAYELLTRTDIKPLILEASERYVGGISKTVEYKGNRIDIGGHRFFSKSDRVMEWWLRTLPIQTGAESEFTLQYQQQNTTVTTNEQRDPTLTDEVMLVRNRVSRIYFNKTLFPYPITLSGDTVRKLGLLRMVKILFTYLRRATFPITPEKSLEDFYINRFGDELYKTFFESYTEKVWGVPCSKISPDWGAQRVKGLSITKALLHFLKKLLPSRSTLGQKNVETSLIERFFYPKLGPGLMWETVAKRVQERGGEIRMGERVTAIKVEGERIQSVTTTTKDGTVHTYEGDLFFSTMPIKELVQSLTHTTVPPAIREISDGLLYRDFMTVGLLAKRLLLKDPTAPGGRITDNWIYIHEPSVKVGRIQVFNNWSEYLVRDQDTVWLGLEYFCNEGDALWNTPDADLIKQGKEEMARLGILDPADVIDGTILREKKTYPAYFGTYDRFPELRGYLDGFENLYLLGRNGMHRYNNQDHSMLTAMVAVDGIIEGRTDKSPLWDVNTEQEYHEKK